MNDPAVYLRPVPCEPHRTGARSAAGGTLRFTEIEVLSRRHPPRVLPADAVTELHPGTTATLDALTRPRKPVAGIDLSRPRIMGIVNVTPDSFSDGGRLSGAREAVEQGLRLVEEGADILDIGGESTRPGAEPVPEPEEADRVLPVIEGLVGAGCRARISVDTRKAGLAKAALEAGAVLFNDVSALTHDPGSAAVAATAGGVCLMHARGDPQTMQNDPRYADVLLDVYDFLSGRVAAAEAAGVARERILVDPGIGFGKTLEHNLALLRRLSVFHGLGCGLLLGASRKRFIGTLSGVPEAGRRTAGSIAAALCGAEEGAHVLRVHDVAETRRALSVWEAIRRPETRERDA